MPTIKDILTKDEYEHISQFTADEQEWLNERIHFRADGKPGIECILRGLNDDGDYYELTPEEVVRQCYTYKLIKDFEYTKEQLKFEIPAIYAGREIIHDKRIDIAVFDKEDKSKLDIIIEVKRPAVKNEHMTYGGEETTPFQQLQSYCRAKQPQIGVLINGDTLIKFYEAPRFDDPLTISEFPHCGENLSDWKENRRFTLKQLTREDRLQKETLKDIILKVEQRFGANDSSDKAFEEIFKLIFIKLYDEFMSSRDADIIAYEMNNRHTELKDIDDAGFRILEFRAKETEPPEEISSRLNLMFDKAKNKWPGVFSDDAILNMQPATIKSCVKELQDVKLFNSNLEVIDDAFEHLVNQNQKEGMGQYFTPRYVIDMCVKMLNPRANEKLIDTAAGSCGFPMHAIFHVWKQLNPEASNLFTTRSRTPEELDYVQNNVFGIDFSEKSVRVGRMLNIIAGDGHTNVIELNSLDYPTWSKAYLNNSTWRNKYNEGFAKLEKMSACPRAHSDSEKFHAFDFDILMANPPFAGDLDNKEQIQIYELGHKANGQVKNKVGRDILFIERNLGFLKPGGRMAIVLPQGRFNNAGDQVIREYISERCRILAVVGLHENVFKPHTGTKTSVLFVQKWTDDKCGYPNICPKPLPDKDGGIDYPIFFATMREPSKDNSGDKIYVTEDYVSWRSFRYITEILYIRRADKEQVTAEEYNAAAKKSDYKLKTVVRKIVTEHKADDKNTDFIKDLFIAEHGELDARRKWILKNSKYVLKNKKGGTRPAEISIDEFLKLPAAERAFYKETDIIGENNNPLIGVSEYNLLDEESRKFYLVAEDVKTYTARVKDTHGHIFVKHDLFNHDPDLQNDNPNNIYSRDGIAEAFAEFAKKEGLSFFQ